MKNDTLNDYQYFVLGASLLSDRAFFVGEEQTVEIIPIEESDTNA